MNPIAEEIVEAAIRKNRRHKVGGNVIEIEGFKISLPNPEIPTPPEVSKVTAITPEIAKDTLAPLEERYPELREVITPEMRLERWILFLPWALVLARSLGTKVWGMSIESPEDRRKMILFAIRVAQGMARKQLG